MLSSMPSLDLHGEYTDSAKVLLDEFINDNIILKNEYVCVVHGIGTDTLRKMVHEMVKKDKRVVEYKRDFFNPGETILKLKIRG